jgi:hypothetical protein
MRAVISPDRGAYSYAVTGYAIPPYGYLKEGQRPAARMYVKCTAVQFALTYPLGIGMRHGTRLAQRRRCAWRVRSPYNPTGLLMVGIYPKGREPPSQPVRCAFRFTPILLQARNCDVLYGHVILGSMVE